MSKKVIDLLLSAGQSAQNSGNLVIGREYHVLKYFAGDDITNIGGENASNTTFTATGTTPANWGNFTEIMDVLLGAPVATVNQNDFFDEIVWEYHGEGQYKGFLEGAFPLTKTHVSPYGMQYICSGYIDGNENDKEAYRVIRESDDRILVQTYRDEQLKDEILYFAPIKITVYD